VAGFVTEAALKRESGVNPEQSPLL
jgi:hypothetical protein